MKESRVTLKDIAEAANVHRTTVSLALRNHPSLPEATRLRIQKLAQEMNYRPDPVLSALMHYRRAAQPLKYGSTIAYITNWPSRHVWRDKNRYRTHVDFYEGVCERAQQHGYQIDEFWLREPGMTAKRCSEILYHRNITGLVIPAMPASTSRGHLRLDWDRFSAVAMGYTLAWPHLHRVSNHQYRSMVLAIRNVRKMGYRRIGLALPASIDERVDHNWIAGYLVEYQRSPASEQVTPFVPKEWSENSFLEWFKEHRPEVIVSIQMDVVEWLSRLKLKVPDDVGFVNIDCADKSGEVAGIYQNWKTTGAAAIDLLAGLLHRNEKGVPELPQTLLIEGTWVNGRTIVRKV